MDSVDPASAERAALGVAGVEHVQVRGRWLGRTLFIEVEVFMPGAVTLAEAEDVTRPVRDLMLAAVPQFRAVVFARHALSNG